MISAAHSRRISSRSDTGAALVLALLFLLVASFTVVALGYYATSAEGNTTILHQERLIETSATSTATITVQQLRTGFNFPGQGDSTSFYTNHVPTTCTPTGAEAGLAVVCEGWQFGATRDVYLQVCNGSATNFSTTNCAAGANGVIPLLTAEVTYIDLPAGQSLTADSCTPTTSGTCGVTMSIDQWDVRASDS